MRNRCASIHPMRNYPSELFLLGTRSLPLEALNADKTIETLMDTMGEHHSKDKKNEQATQRACGLS